jgi:hypothetical protein
MLTKTRQDSRESAWSPPPCRPVPIRPSNGARSSPRFSSRLSYQCPLYSFVDAQ